MEVQKEDMGWSKNSSGSY